MKRKIYIGIAIFLIFDIFGWAETWYYGWNWFPRTNGEKICDIIATLGSAVGYWILFYYLVKYIDTKITIK